MKGGLGDDIYYVNSIEDNVIENLGEGLDIVYAFADNTSLADNVEHLYLFDQEAVSATGNTLNNYVRGNVQANVLYGLAGNDLLNGLAGSDTLVGGLGDDIYYVDVIEDNIVEASGEGLDSVYSFAEGYSLVENVENLYLINQSLVAGSGNSSNNYLQGNSQANVLQGLEGNDYLNGLSGEDTLLGGDGNDIYYVDSAGDQVIENLDEGIDSVYSYANGFELAENVENLYLYEHSLTSGVGNNLNNYLQGNSQNNTLQGLAGNDRLNGIAGQNTLEGGIGNDTYYINSQVEQVVERVDEGVDSVHAYVDNLSLAENVENLYLVNQSITSGTGNTLNNYLQGNQQGNLLQGLAGNDILSGLDGEDTLIGGTGNDIYYVNSESDQVLEELNAGTDSVYAYTDNLSLTANVENLYLINQSLTSGIGNSLNNYLQGNQQGNLLQGLAGNDRLAGLGGADTLEGGLGNDIYYVDSVEDQILEEVNEGVDIVYAFTDDLSLTSNVENLYLINQSLTSGTGNSLDNYLRGNQQDNILRGLDGLDQLKGLSGSDTLEGGAQADQLWGGTGSDTFRFSLLSDSLLQAYDRIMDFDIGVDNISSTNAVHANDILHLEEVSSLAASHLELELSEIKVNGAATFHHGNRSFLILNDDQQGFQSDVDSFIEISGFSGDLSQINILNA